MRVNRDKIIVKLPPQEKERKTEGGLIIPIDSSTTTQIKGEVIACGEGFKELCKPGDIVVISTFAGIPLDKGIIEGDGEYKLLNQTECYIYN